MPQKNNMPEERLVNPLSNYPPMQFRENNWWLIQDEGYNYTNYEYFHKNKTDREIVNKMYTDFHRIPGDLALKIVAETFGIDIESREIAEELYKASLKVRIRE